MNKQKKIDFPFSKQKFIKTKEFFEHGINNYLIGRLISEGKIVKLNGSTYENTSYSGNENDFLYVDAYVNSGIVCLFSAAVYHGISTFRSDSVDVAIKNKAKVGKLPESPKIALYYFSDERFNLGIEEITIDGGTFKIYDMEKTVCDLLSYRNKLYLEDVLDVLKRYLKKRDRDINKLMRYAEKLRIYNILSKYLEVLL